MGVTAKIASAILTRKQKFFQYKNQNLHRHLNHIKAEFWYLIDHVRQRHIFLALRKHQIFQQIIHFL
jgi:hypothetical protein